MDVITYIARDGTLSPMVMYWKEKKYPIEKVTEIRETYSRAGGSGIRYTCAFRGQMRNLFWERNRWFIESEIFEPGQND